MGSRSSKSRIELASKEENQTNNSLGNNGNEETLQSPVINIPVPPAAEQLPTKVAQSIKPIDKEKDVKAKSELHSGVNQNIQTDVCDDKCVINEQTVVNDDMAGKYIDEYPIDQMKFDCALKSACLLVKQDSIYRHITENVTKLHLSRALPKHFSLPVMLNKFTNLKDLDLSMNNMGPQCFRAICLAMCSNCTILSLNLADNKADIDSVDCIAQMIEENSVLQYLDASSNYLGKDYFSRKVGPALKKNTALRTLRCESIGMTDCRVLLEGLKSNTSLTDLDISNNGISDKIGFGQCLLACLKKADAVLSTLCLSRCELNAAELQEIQSGISQNNTLCEINLNGSQFDSLGGLVAFITTAAKHPCVRNLSLDSSSIKSKDISLEIPLCESTSSLKVLSLNACGISDIVFTSLERIFKGKLLLNDVDVTANEELTVACIDSIAKLTSVDGGKQGGSSLKNFRFGLNKCDGLAEKLPLLQNLQYLNLRMCRVSHDTLSAIGNQISAGTIGLSTLILDGLKLSKTSVLKDLLGNPKSNKLTTLSVGGSSLDDSDIIPVCEAVMNGLQLNMLKLAANRITDVGVARLAEVVLKCKTHPLAVLDLSNNSIANDGAKSLASMCTLTTKLGSLNVSSNNIGKEGLLALMSVTGGKSHLQTLYVQGQRVTQDEGHMVDVFNALSSTLGYRVQLEGDKVKPGCCDLPANLPNGLTVNLTNLGGNTGSIGQAIDSVCIQTDFVLERLPYLNLTHVMQICSFLKGDKQEFCTWSETDWNMITGADRATNDAPSWLKVSSDRDKCIYISNLPGNATLQKVEALLEMDADCSVVETCLMKDPVTRSINGLGWSLMSDQASVQKALTLFENGQANVFGQVIMISEVKVKVDNAVSSELLRNAEKEREVRMKVRVQEEAAHKTLIINTTEASWKRHAYRLANPAYADGRIW